MSKIVSFFAAIALLIAVAFVPGVSSNASARTVVVVHKHAGYAGWVPGLGVWRVYGGMLRPQYGCFGWSWGGAAGTCYDRPGGWGWWLYPYRTGALW